MSPSQMKEAKNEIYRQKKYNSRSNRYNNICPNNHRYWDINLESSLEIRVLTSWFIFTIFVYKPVNMKNGKELKPIALEIIVFLVVLIINTQKQFISIFQRGLNRNITNKLLILEIKDINKKLNKHYLIF
jgi:hypothetical protein